VVPCCGKCNRLRSDLFTHEEMLLFMVPLLQQVKGHRGRPWNEVIIGEEVETSNKIA
jgi:hypothetical protein